MGDTKSQIFQLINEAIHVDSVGNVETAYLKYVESVLAISRYLLNQFLTIGFPHELNNVQEIKKILSVGKECWERLNNLLSESEQKEESKTKNLQSKKDIQYKYVDNNESFLEMHNFQHENEPFSISETSFSNSNTNAHSSSNIIDFPEVNSSSIVLHRCQITPLEKCRRDNAKLRKSYQSRIMQAKNPLIKANLRLELQRNIEENVVIAKAKETQYFQDQQRKAKEALKQATKVLSKSDEKFTIANNEKCQLYADILQFEEHQKWVEVLRDKLSSHPKDEACMEEIITKTLRSDHPLAEWVHLKRKLVNERCCYLLDSHKHLYTNLCTDITNILGHELDEVTNLQINEENTASNSPTFHDTVLDRTDEINNLRDNLEMLVNDLCNICDMCVLMLGLIYTKLNESELAQDICYQTVEDIILSPLWYYLVLLFRCVNLQIESKVAQVMKQSVNCTPKDFGFKKLLSDKTLSLYDECASKLKSSPSIKSPVPKLQLFVQVVQKLCECQKTDGSGSPLTPVLLGADDLIPILSYVLVQTSIPYLLSECEALEQLLDQRYLLGEDGYCLTSFQMAFKYLEAQFNNLSSKK